MTEDTLSRKAAEKYHEIHELCDCRSDSCRCYTSGKPEFCADCKRDIGRLAALISAQVEQPLSQEYWTCFNCEFKTTDRKEAEAHFGDDDEGQSICQTWAQLNADERLEEYQSQIRERNAVERENASLRTSNEGLEYRVHAEQQSIRSYKPFKACSSINDVFFVYDSMEGRALANQERAEAAELALAKEIALAKENAEECNKMHLRDSAALTTANAELEKLRNEDDIFSLDQEQWKARLAEANAEADKLRQLLDLYRRKRSVDGLNGRVWHGPLHYEYEMQIAADDAVATPAQGGDEVKK